MKKIHYENVFGQVLSMFNRKKSSEVEQTYELLKR